MRDELATTNEYKDKFKASSERLDEMLEIQRHGKDMRGIEYEKEESFGFGQGNTKPDQKKSKNPLIR